MAGIEIKVFAESAAEQIRAYLPEEYQDMEWRVIERKKNNSVPRVGIDIHMPGNDGICTVYVESFYDEIRKGAPLEKVLKEIAGAVMDVMPDRALPADLDVKDYHSVKDYLKVALVNTKANRAMLMEHPHMGVEDLSVILKVELPETGNGGKPEAKVTNSLAAYWGIGREELFKNAAENTWKKHPPILAEITHIVEELEGISREPENLLEREQVPETMCPMYVLTNKEKQEGAASMLSPYVLERISGMFPEGYYILPSSINEVLIVPKSTCLSAGELGSMVRDINQSVVQREEILSDRVYEYDKEKGIIRQVPESMERGQVMER